MRIIGLLLILCSITTPALAYEPALSPSPGVLPGERPADQMLNEHVQRALDVWRSRGINSCDGIAIQAFFVDSIPETWNPLGKTIGIAAIDGCRLGDPRQWINYPAIRTGNAYGEASECGVVEHETGHLLGLDHDDAATFPIMAEQFIIPDYCWDLAFKSQAERNEVAPVQFLESEGHEGEIRVCVPAWAGRSTLKITRLWWQEKMGTALKEFRKWKKKHPLLWKKNFRKGERCMYFTDEGPLV